MHLGCSAWSGSKFALIHTRHTLTVGGAQDRPIDFAQRMNTSDNAMYIDRRDGSFYERGIPWNWDSVKPLGNFITDVPQFGCGQYDVAPTPNAGLYMDIGGCATVARHLNGWIGPRSGF